MFTLDECQSIIKALPSSFDSHEFIRVGALLYPSSYLDMIREYEGNFTTVDALIGSFLLRNAAQLGIQKVAEQVTETIVGTQGKCALWNKSK